MLEDMMGYSEQRRTEDSQLNLNAFTTRLARKEKENEIDATEWKKKKVTESERTEQGLTATPAPENRKQKGELWLLFII